jgi:dihydroorotase-like cyclic amidohydrolase
VVGCLIEMGVDPGLLSQICSVNPGRFFEQFSLNPRELKAGNVANITVLEKQETEIISDKLFTKSQWSPFSGCTFPWGVDFTVIRGRVWKKDPGQ